MASAHEAFWTHSSYAFVGHSAKKGFPRTSYSEAKKGGKKVFELPPLPWTSIPFRGKRSPRCPRRSPRMLRSSSVG